MTSLRGLVLGAAAVAALATAPAGADDTADLKATLAHGMASLTSLRVVMKMTVGSATMTVLFPAEGVAAAPHKLAMKMQMSGPTVAMNVYIVDGYMYQNFNGSAWEKRPLPDVSSALHLGPGFGDPGQIAPLPDRTVDGVTYGAFTESPPAALAASPLTTFTCTYDKPTGRMHSCGNDVLTMTYEGFNDPANAVELPAAARDAVALPAIPLFPPPAVLPAPAGTP